MRKILILGMGNILLKDEGVGVRSIEYLQNQKMPKNVSLLDGGTGGFTLLPEILKYDEVILIDATLDHYEAGTIRVIKPKFAADFPRAMTTHDIGLKDLIESASILGKLPPIHLIVISIDRIQPMDLKLSPEIEIKLPEIHKTVEKILEEIEIE